MIDRVKTCYEMEYKSVIRWINGEYCKTIDDRKNCINNAIQRCLGVALFVQMIDVPFKEIDFVYEEYRKKFYALLKVE